MNSSWQSAAKFQRFGCGLSEDLIQHMLASTTNKWLLELINTPFRKAPPGCHLESVRE